MSARRIAVFDPSGRVAAEAARVADKREIEIVVVASPADPLLQQVDAVLVAAPVAAELPVAGVISAPRWVVGEPSNANRLAGAAVAAAAVGVLLSPLGPESLHVALEGERPSVEADALRARALIAAPLVESSDVAGDALRLLATTFHANDCIVWWREGENMSPTSAREEPAEGYRAAVAAAARIAAATGGTAVVAQGERPPCAVMAEALRASPNEVSGLLAVVSDKARRFSLAERSDLRALATRFTRELALRATHRRLVAEGERLSAGSMHDPLTGAMMRAAFEQGVTHEIAAALRRGEVATVLLFDLVGLRRINLEHGHRAGDEALAQVAARARACVRASDPMGRLGGDELAILLVNATDVQGVAVARKLVARVLKDPIVVESVPLRVQLRLVLSEVARGERSGVAAFSRCYSALRGAAPNDPVVVPPDEPQRLEAEAQLESQGLTVGTVVGGTYRVLHELSRGAMGVVYRGEDLGLGRPVAIKVLRADLASDRELVARFRAEAGLLASLHHDNLVSVYALGEHAGDVYFVMELVEGQPLSDVLRRTLDNDEWFPVAPVIQITSEIADALDAMHARGLIHRDVKPANILLDRVRDRAVLVDVGVAAKTGAAREAAGTPGFAAPESFYEGGDSPPTDVYGLAATVYCALTGRAPFGSGQPLQVVQRQLHDPLIPASAVRPSLPPAVDAVLAKALDPSPKRRWASASTFAIALARALGPMRADEAPTPRSERSALDNAAGVMGPTASLSADEVARLPTQSSDPIVERRVIAGAVRAFHARVLGKIVAHHLGESSLTALAGERPHLATLLSSQIAPLSWIELRAFCELLEATSALLPEQELARRVGRSSITATFAQLFGADPASLPIPLVLSAAPTFWPRYHDWGPISIEAGEAQADLTLGGFPGNALVCTLVGGQFQRIIELAGGGDVTVDALSCTLQGAPSCRFSATWIPRSLGG